MGTLPTIDRTLLCMPTTCTTTILSHLRTCRQGMCVGDVGDRATLSKIARPMPIRRTTLTKAKVYRNHTFGEETSASMPRSFWKTSTKYSGKWSKRATSTRANLTWTESKHKLMIVSIRTVLREIRESRRLRYRLLSNANCVRTSSRKHPWPNVARPQLVRNAFKKHWFKANSNAPYVGLSMCMLKT